jgi:hypothetical protein
MRHCLFVLALLGGCNTHQQHCEKLGEKVTAIVDGVRAASGSSSDNKLDQVIFSLMRSHAELVALELPDPELDQDRRRVVRLVESDLSAFRAFAAVYRNHDPADVEDLRDKLQAADGEQRTIVEALTRHCR